VAGWLVAQKQLGALSQRTCDRNPLGLATPPLPPADLSQALDLAAQAHADYNSTNSILGHTEDPTNSGFVGVNPGDRSSYFGYSRNVSEDAAELDAVGSIDTLMNSVYHRVPIQSYVYTDIGFGLSQLSGNQRSVVDFGRQRGGTPVSRMLIPYPANGQGNVPTTFNGGEIPSPLPSGVTNTGYPVSLRIEQPANVQKGSSTISNTYQLTDSSGKAVLVYPLDRASDPNKYLGGDDFFMFPQQPLIPNTTYNAHITGTDSQSNAFDASWSFTTIPNATVVSVIRN